MCKKHTLVSITVLRPVRLTLFAVIMAVVSSPPIVAQDFESGAVRLGLLNEPGYVPALVVSPIMADSNLAEFAGEVEEIVRRDLYLSDRFDIISVPDSLRSEGPPNYPLWNQLGAVWLVTSDVSGPVDSPILRVALHDVVYGTLKSVQAFSLPETSADGFRMAVHRVTDEIVSWATDGEQGIAATRIAFRRGSNDGTWALWVIDSDGENAQRISTGEFNVFSPAFSPDGSRIAYTIQDDLGYFTLLETNRITRSQREIASSRLLLTPNYVPDGRLAYAQLVGSGAEVILEGVGQITDTRGDALNPTFSPDGRRFAFEADPTGEPQVYVKPVVGGQPRRISVYVRNERTNAVGPDWSPDGSRIVYTAMNKGSFQIFTVNPDGTDRRMLTSRGQNEAPSWAPDGRHVVFESVDVRGRTIWILDTVTGRSRVLTSGQLDYLPDWSPPLPLGS